MNLKHDSNTESTPLYKNWSVGRAVGALFVTGVIVIVYFYSDGFSTFSGSKPDSPGSSISTPQFGPTIGPADPTIGS